MKKRPVQAYLRNLAKKIFEEDMSRIGMGAKPEPARKIALRYGLDRKTVQIWRQRGVQRTGPREHRDRKQPR
jgi:hypothetical protein